MGETFEQGRFGPPPVAHVTMSIRRTERGLWDLVVAQQRQGCEWERRAELYDLPAHELVEAVAVESQR